MAYYENNLHWFEKDIKVNVQEVLVSDSSLAHEIYQSAKTGANFDSLAANYTEREGARDNNGVLGFISRRNYGLIGRTAVKLKTGEISEPIQFENRFSIIKILLNYR